MAGKMSNTSGSREILQLSQELRAAAVGLPGIASLALRKAALDLKGAFEIHSPVGEGGKGASGGSFRGDWDIKEDKPGGETLAQVAIFNRMPYAPPIELGSPVGGKPWPSAGPRTVEEGGRIWSSQAVGGVIGVVLDGDDGMQWQEETVKAIQTFILRGLRKVSKG